MLLQVIEKALLELGFVPFEDTEPAKEDKRIVLLFTEPSVVKDLYGEQTTAFKVEVAFDVSPPQVSVFTADGRTPVFVELNPEDPYLWDEQNDDWGFWFLDRSSKPDWIKKVNSVVQEALTYY